MAVQDLEWKLIVPAVPLHAATLDSLAANRVVKPRLFHLAADPDERVDSFESERVRATALLSALRAWDDSLPIPRTDIVQSARDIEQAARRLGELGYGDGVGQGVRAQKPATRELVLVANTRLPSGWRKRKSCRCRRLLRARALRRRCCTPLPRHAVAAAGSRPVRALRGARGARPALRAIACIDLIDSLPRCAVPAGASAEISFVQRVARGRARHANALVLSREIECASCWWPSCPVCSAEIHRPRRAHAPPLARSARPAQRRRRRDLRACATTWSSWACPASASRSSTMSTSPPALRIRPRASELASASMSRGDARLVVYTGGLLAWKGVDVLVDALRELPDVRLVIAGGMGADVERLRVHARGANNVHRWLPAARRASAITSPQRISRSCRIARSLRSARATRRRSRCLEAMAAGVALVASDRHRCASC